MSHAIDDNTANPHGRVSLVGAGPGDPDLITVKGLRRIQTADVILYDRLIPHDLLHEARHDAELVDVGKQPKRHRLSQTLINDLIIERARRGLHVVRLKGGDPFVFGRGGEEVQACQAAGIPVEVIPGISSAIAAPAAAGIPVTQRHVSSGFTVITGHEDPTKPHLSIDYDALARLNTTLVVLMGVNQLPHIVQRLLDAGYDGNTPAAIIENGTLPQQRSFTARIADLPRIAIEANVQSPAITIIGEVVQTLTPSEAATFAADVIPNPIAIPILES